MPRIMVSLLPGGLLLVQNQMHWVGLRNGWMGGFRMGGWVEGCKCLQRRRRGTVKRGIVAEAACATRRPTASGRTSRKKTASRTTLKASRKPDYSAAGRSRQRTRSTTTRKGGPNTQCRRVDVDSRVVVWRLILDISFGQRRVWRNRVVVVRSVREVTR